MNVCRGAACCAPTRPTTQGERNIFRTNTLARLALVGLPLSFLALFFYYPLANILREGITENSEFTWNYLVRIFSDDYFQHILRFTVWQALLSTLASIALGFPLAYILTRYDFPIKRIIRSLTIVPFVLPSVTVALGFTIMFGRSGWVNQSLMALFGLSEPPLQILYSLAGIVLAHAFYNAPIITRTVHAAWERIDPRYEESARALGASRFSVFKDITLPMLMPGLMTGATLVFIFCFLSFPIVLTLGGSRFSTIEVEIYTRVVTLLDYKLGAALALVGLALSLVFVYGYLRLEGRFARQTESLKSRPTVPLFNRWSDLRKPGKLSLLSYLVLSLIFFLGPMLSVVADSFTEETENGSHYTGRWYSYIFQPSYDTTVGDSPLGAIWNSLRFGLGATALALFVGLAIAFVIARLKFRGRRLFDAFVMIPLTASSVILAFGLLRAYLAAPLKLAGTGIAVIIAHAIIIFPFIVRAVVPILENLDLHLVEAARMLGAKRWQAFRQIELPLIAGGVLVGAVFAFALSLGEMSATLMLARPGLKTMPVAVYDFLGTRNFGAASAMSVLLMGVSAIAFVCLERVGEKFLR